MTATCQRLLEDPEVRVRWAVGELLRALCEQLGISVWEKVQACVLESITRNFDRDAAEPSGQLPDHGSGAGSLPQRLAISSVLVIVLVLN